MKTSSIVGVLLATLIGFWGCFLVVRALSSGIARGRFGRRYSRQSQPVMYWVVVLRNVLFVVLASLLGWTVAHGGSGSAFRARHPVAVGDTVPASPVAPSSSDGCATPGRRVCLVAVGAAPDVLIDSLAKYYATLLGSPVGILDPIALTRQAGGPPIVDAQRLQVGAGAVEGLVRATYPMLWGDRDVTVVILTGNDLWLESRPDQRYAFGEATVRNGGGGFAIVSSARMDPAAYGQAADPAVLERRMHAMLGKYFALLLYGATPSADPTSPVYNAVRSPEDLDRMRPFSPQ